MLPMAGVCQMGVFFFFFRNGVEQLLEAVSSNYRSPSLQLITICSTFFFFFFPVVTRTGTTYSSHNEGGATTFQFTDHVTDQTKNTFRETTSLQIKLPVSFTMQLNQQ